MNEPILLIVDDEKNTRDGLRMALEESFDCYVASDISEAMRILKSEDIDVMLTDLRMGADSGMDLLEQAQKLPKPPISIMMTAYGSVDTAVEAMRRGAWHFVTKPLNLDEVELLAKRAIQQKARKPVTETVPEPKTTKNKSSNKGLAALIGESPAMEKIHSMIQQVAPTKATVLIEGESGTGKELVAQAIHHLSDRPSEKMITVNCAALSPQLLESELFGHEKGSFTGATQKRIGRFEQAHGGTLFLDEIGEIDASTQVKLLRALSERTIERVGSNTPVKVDVRIVTATNKDLAQLVKEGNFREDLYFRLNVVKITMPPLRERGSDSLILANLFLKEFAEENNKSIYSFSENASRTLQAYTWPGNVRELRTTIEHGVVMCNDEMIKLSHLPNRIQVNENIHIQATRFTPLEPKPKPTPVAAQNTLSPVPQPTTDQENLNLADLERRTIERALEITRGNRTEAASLLGISRRTLHRKINTYQESE